MLKFTAMAVLAALTAVPLTATETIVINTTGASGNAASYSFTSGGINFTTTARSFAIFPNALTSISQLTATGLQVSRSTAGIGVNGGASAPQIDTN